MDFKIDRSGSSMGHRRVLGQALRLTCAASLALPLGAALATPMAETTGLTLAQMVAAVDPCSVGHVGALEHSLRCQTEPQSGDLQLAALDVRVAAAAAAVDLSRAQVSPTIGFPGGVPEPQGIPLVGIALLALMAACRGVARRSALEPEPTLNRR